jgi:hypothetical protein
MTRLSRECDFPRAKEGEQAAADQRHLKRKVILLKSPPKWRMIGGRVP